jgi:hypothetical protein
LLVLSLWRVVAQLAPGWPAAARIIAVILVLSAVTSLWHTRYWDRFVAPDHNVYEWNLRKVLGAHLPFLLLALAHLAWFDESAMFVGAHVVALAASAVAMRFPPWWAADAPAHSPLGVRE